MARHLAVMTLTILSLGRFVLAQQAGTMSPPAQNSGLSSSLTISDSSFLFDVTFPADWTTKQAADRSSFFRLKGSSPDKKVFVDVYAGSIDQGFVNVEHLADGGKKTFDFLGDVVERRKIAANRYEVSYDNKNKYSEYAKALYIAKETHYYILIAYSRSHDLSATNQILNSIRIRAPFSWPTVIFLIGTTSLLFHLVVPTFFALYAPVRLLRDDGVSGIGDVIGWPKWTVLVLPLWCGAYYLLFRLDAYVVTSLTAAYSMQGVDGVFANLLEIGPEAFEAAGEFISEGIAEVAGVGFWPGGLTGVVLSTIVSVTLNLIEVRAVMKWLVNVTTLTD
jgi:hypothetical protein